MCWGGEDAVHGESHGDQAFGVHIGVRGKGMEHVADADEFIDAFMVAEGWLERGLKHLRVGDEPEVVEELGSNLNLEVVCQKFKQTRESFEPGDGESLGIHEVHQDWPETYL